jgi:hypothetical protein
LFIFMCNFFSSYFSILSPFFSSIDFFKFKNRLVQCLALVMQLVPRVHNAMLWSVVAEWLGRRTINQRVVGSNAVTVSTIP